MRTRHLYLFKRNAPDRPPRLALSFGPACRCATFIGTHAYMSPERLGGKPYSFASDIWSLGITLVECALAQFPYTAYTGSNYFVLLSQILNDPPPQLPDCCPWRRRVAQRGRMTFTPRWPLADVWAFNDISDMKCS